MSQYTDHESFDSTVSVDWLVDRLGRDDVVIADCRFVLSDPEAGRRAYETGHIPGAVYFDLERDLSRPAGSSTGVDDAQSIGPTGGRHPLPSVRQMTQLFSNAGIGDGVKVVCYDDQKGSIAGRLWWMLRLLGHREVALLDGGFSAWREAGYPVSSTPATPTPRTFVARPQPHMLATADDVRRVIASGQGVVIDSRAPERYRGEVEPLDPVAGHIPGAINLPWDGTVDDKGRLHQLNELDERFKRVRDRAGGTADRGVIVHCGSGVTGCINVLGLERAGITDVRLYVGGWSEWCSDPDNPVATGPEDDETIERTGGA